MFYTFHGLYAITWSTFTCYLLKACFLRETERWSLVIATCTDTRSIYTNSVLKFFNIHKYLFLDHCFAFFPKVHLKSCTQHPCLANHFPPAHTTGAHTHTQTHTHTHTRTGAGGEKPWVPHLQNKVKKIRDNRKYFWHVVGTQYSGDLFIIFRITLLMKILHFYILLLHWESQRNFFSLPTAKHNLENSRGVGNSTVFTHIFTLSAVPFSFLMFHNSFFYPLISVSGTSFSPFFFWSRSAGNKFS